MDNLDNLFMETITEIQKGDEGGKNSKDDVWKIEIREP